MIAALLLAVLGKLRARPGVHALDLSLVISLQRTLGRVSRLEGLLRLLQRSRLVRVRRTHGEQRADWSDLRFSTPSEPIETEKKKHDQKKKNPIRVHASECLKTPILGEFGLPARNSGWKRSRIGLAFPHSLLQSCRHRIPPPTSCCTNRHEEMSDQEQTPLSSQLRLCTYNIFAWRTAAWTEYNEELVAELFQRLDADVYSMNEVRSEKTRRDANEA